MKITLEREVLEKKLQAAVAIIPAKPIIPALDHALIEVTDKRMLITTTDTSITLTVHLPCEVEGELTDFVCDIQTIMKSIATMKDESIVLDVNLAESVVILTVPGKKRKYEIPVFYNASSFPRMNSAEWTKPIALNGIQLATMINRASAEIITTDMRPALTGINLLLKDNTLTIFGGTPFSFCRSILNLQTEDDRNIPEIEAVIPKGVIKAIDNYSKSPTVEVSIDKDGRNLMLSDGVSKTCILLVDSKTVDVNPLYNAANIEVNTSFDKNQLLPALKRVALYSNKVSNTVRLDYSQEDVSIEGSDPDFRQKAIEWITPIHKSEEMNFSSSINHKFLLNIITVAPGEKIIISQLAENQPFVIMDDSEEGFKTMWLVAAVYNNNAKDK